MRLANFERVRGLDSEWKLLRCPVKHCLPNLTPLWANGNLGATLLLLASERIADKAQGYRVQLPLSTLAQDATVDVRKRNSLPYGPCQSYCSVHQQSSS
jgi:hypothetical protein